MDILKVKNDIISGNTALGIEFGSTRIKAVLIGSDNTPIASGAHEWENRLINGIWTYTEEDIIGGMQSCYASLANEIETKFGIVPTRFGSIGISAMMHGYMAFDENDNLLVPFRTWRNTITAEASEELTELFGFPIPQRWSIAHLYQCILNNEEHLPRLSHLTTLAGYIHYLLTGRRVLGIGEASGMFPVDSSKLTYNKQMADKFDNAAYQHGFDKPILSLLPEVLIAGENAGTLSESGAKLLDVSGNLGHGIPMCAPEGDAGTGMVATDSVSPRTGNVSAGTSVFAMVVLDKPLKELHRQIDMVTTPSGEPVAMVHCNNCTSELNAWAGLFREFAQAAGFEIDSAKLYEILFKKALEGKKDCDGMIAYNYLSGEHITGFEEGRPLFARRPDAQLTLADFMRTQLYTSLGALKAGLDILTKEEQVPIDRLTGHGGFFKTEKVGQTILAAAAGAPITVMSTAGEGGAWGMALLAMYMNKKSGETLGEWLKNNAFANARSVTVEPDKDDAEGFDEFMKKYIGCLPVERSATQLL
ncbi:MAG: xylulokinase [Ruminiclostridium sp.]